MGLKNVKEKPLLFENLLDVDRLLTAREVAERLGVHEFTVRRWRHRGQIQPLKIGPKMVRYRWGDVVKWIKTNGV